VTGDNRFARYRAGTVRVLLIASVAAIVGTIGSAGAHAATPRVMVAGTMSPAVAGSGRIASVPASAPLRVTLSLRPRHPALLERLAGRSTGRAPLSPARIASLFYPTPAQVALLNRTMRAQGLKPLGVQGLSATYAGRTSAAESAFGMSLGVYRGPDGGTFRAPAGRVSVPRAIAPLVADVQGLDTSQSLQPLNSGVQSASLGPACTAANSFRSVHGGYLPGDLAASNAYNHGALESSGADGSGEAVALIEFSNYHPSDVSVFQSCIGTEVPLTTVRVAGGTSTVSGADEVTLDVEEVVGAAPDLDRAYVYVAPVNGTIAQVVNAILAGQATTHVHVISDSWGLCEAAMSPAGVEANAHALQLAAVAGISVFAASGDDGSYDCFGFPMLSVDDPASEPWVAGVGGTALNTSVASGQPQHEVTWNQGSNAGGGGVSRFWTAPAWQTGPGVHSSFSSSGPCQATPPAICREVPDVALDAATGNRGYVVYCTSGPCGGAGWQTIGGTSGAAPLMAGNSADANEYSLAHGGQRMGYANPFLYDTFRTDPSAFHDITLGNNNVGGKSQYPATSGYDMATGIGSPDAVELGTQLSLFTPAALSVDPTTLAASPSGNRTIKFGQSVSFGGVLRNSSDHPIVHARVFLQLEDQTGVREWTRFTDSDGHWLVRLSTSIDRKAHWRVSYLGTRTHAPAVRNGFMIYVIPPLALGSSLPLQHGVYQAHVGKVFDLRGHTMHQLAGHPVLAEYRPSTGSRWTKIGTAAVTSTGLYHRFFKFPHTGNYVVRWVYQGGTTGQWLSSASPGHVFAVRP
jgi:kumamolisin